MSDVQVLMTGIVLGESPRWHDGRLWFSDWGAQELLVVDPFGRSEVVMRDVAALPFCFDWSADGALLIVAGRKGLVLRRDRDGSVATCADLTGLSRHPWNEIVVGSSGNAYVNNSGFEFPGGEFAPGTIALVQPDGSAQTVADGVAFPNGMAITADDRTLILAESYGRKLTAFDIAADGGLSRQRVWADLGDGVPDGICCDAEGAVWYADVPNKRCVRVREGGEVLQTIELDRGCFACMLGGAEGQTLFMVANEWRGPSNMLGAERTGRVLTARAPAPHAGRP